VKVSENMSQRTLMELLYGKGAHANPVTAVQGIPAQLAGRKVEGFPHSICEMVGHMNYWTHYELCRIWGEHPFYPAHAAESWPSFSAPTESEWKQVVASFAAGIDQLSMLTKANSGFLNREVNPTHAVPDQPPYCVLDVLWQTAIHNSYHVGQIVLLRRVLNAWPTEASDTW
jgi:DinB superfamily